MARHLNTRKLRQDALAIAGLFVLMLGGAYLVIEALPEAAQAITCDSTPRPAPCKPLEPFGPPR